MTLTPRQQQVLEGIAAGRTLKEIADRIGIHRSTVDKYRGDLLLKFDANNSTAMCVKAVRMGMLK